LLVAWPACCSCLQLVFVVVLAAVLLMLLGILELEQLSRRTGKVGYTGCSERGLLELDGQCQLPLHGMHWQQLCMLSV